MLQKDYENAIEILLKAEKNTPNDYVILSNIAQVYKLKGDKKNSIKYYELVSKFGDNIAKQYARDQIKELEKSK
jgi:tetratricopeptide (TPR) repeat protein